MWKYERTQSQIDQEIRAYPSVETGGVLLGRIFENRVIISHASGGGPNAYRSEIGFQADDDFVRMYMDEHFANNPELKYVGEWHTHPQIRLKPSPLDYRSMRSISDNNQMDVMMLIIGFVDYFKSKIISEGHYSLHTFNPERCLHIANNFISRVD